MVQPGRRQNKTKWNLHYMSGTLNIHLERFYGARLRPTPKTDLWCARGEGEDGVGYWAGEAGVGGCGGGGGRWEKGGGRELGCPGFTFLCAAFSWGSITAVLLQHKGSSDLLKNIESFEALMFYLPYPIVGWWGITTRQSPAKETTHTNGHAQTQITIPKACTYICG